MIKKNLTDISAGFFFVQICVKTPILQGFALAFLAFKRGECYFVNKERKCFPHEHYKKRILAHQ